jgi:hypothetical protein
MNIYDPKLNKTKICLGGKAKELMSNVDKIQEEVCGLLNGGGGVILSDCEQVSMEFIPRG